MEKVLLPRQAQVLRSTGRSIQFAQAAVQAARKRERRAMAGQSHLAACSAHQPVFPDHHWVLQKLRGAGCSVQPVPASQQVHT